MLKLLTIVLGLTALAAPALSADYHHTRCQLSYPDDASKSVVNACVMTYKDGSTYVRMGDLFLLIVRDPNERGAGRLYVKGGDKRPTFMGTALATGSCWVSTQLRFCAD
jgi:hypothetical protein